MSRSSAVRCELSEVSYRAWPAAETMTVRCRIRTARGSATADGYGTAAEEPLARRKALSEAVERLVACSPLAQVVRPPSPVGGTLPGFADGHSGVRTAPPGCLTRRYSAPASGPDRRIPLFWSSPWVAGEELRAGVLRAADARLSSTIGWAAAPDPEAALTGALLELTESVDYGVFLYRRLAGPPRRALAPGAAGKAGPDPELVTLAGVTRTPTVLAVARHANRLMPATGLGSGHTLAQAQERALLELAQAETMWRLNPTAESAERQFMRRFERWPALRRCVALDFDLNGPGPAPAVAAAPGPNPTAPLSPLEELSARSLRVWADRGTVDLLGPDLPPTRLSLAHVVTEPQPLLGLVRAGIPVFDTEEVRRTLAPHSPARAADRRDPGRNPQGRRTA
ncbi:YcaO-like family protein [Streptomyces sp. NPDC102490]|uniref:YcaO-like family protein n=1 Tax=Streptomyces sp. NPDC102490 TaxID=3366183 RepID=UPI00382DFDE0